ncbi:MAG: hypothetical protein GXO74_10910 [Calditrichaeota bacterium]|nr:hypothetical protein [Calditrichota bacterium]
MKELFLPKYARILLFFICCFSTPAVNGQSTFDPQSVLFENFSIDDGLSQSSLTCLLQDSKGFLWIGSGDGLNRYDGRSFTVFSARKDDSSGLSNNIIWRLFEDSEGYIWVATQNGLNRFDWRTETFRRFMSNPDDSSTISNNTVWSFAEDIRGNLWVGTFNGLNCYKKAENRFIRYFYRKPNNSETTQISKILSLYYDKRDILWVGTYHGLIRLDLQSMKSDTYFVDAEDTVNSKRNYIFTIEQDGSGNLLLGTGDGLFKMDDKNRFVRYSFQNKELTHVSIFSIHVAKDNNIWAASYGQGLFYIDAAKGTVYQWKIDEYQKSSLVYDYIFEIMEDRSGILWIATGSGLSKLDLRKKRFRTFMHSPACENCLSDNIVWAVFQDSRGELWFGTDRGGLNRYNPQTKKFKVYLPDSKNATSINARTVMSIAEERRRRLWLSTFEGGVNVLDINSEKLISYQHDKNDSASISSNYIQSVYVDAKQRVWLGSQEGVLNYYDEDRDKFIRYPLATTDTKNAAWSNIWCISEDGTGNLLIGSEVEGLIRFNPETEKKEYLFETTPLKELKIPSVISIFADKKSGIIWLGTGGYGLIKYSPQTGSARLFNHKIGLPNEQVYGILPENDKSTGDLRALWLSTDKGLVRFDVKSESLKVYNAGDGLPSNEFDSGAYFESKRGEMYFGTINGVVYFDPEQIQEDGFCPPVTITGFKLFNKPVKVGAGKNEILKRSITETKEIVLNYDQNIFSIEFAILHFRNPKQQKYQYQMAGLDDKWIDLGNKNEVTFAHIPPGKYEFKVRGCNSDGVWSEKVSALKIRVIPPFWKKLQFQIIATLMVLLLLLGYHKYRTGIVKRRNKRLKHFNELLNREIEDRKKAQSAISASLEEKEILLKEIHHRVKNNLQVTSSLLYLQSKNIKDEKAKAYLQESQSRIKSMAMIHEKLYRSENFSRINSRDYIRDLATYVFRSYASSGQKIKLNVRVEPVDFDLDTAIPCGLILNELISNSLKYAFPNGRKGEITVSLQEKENDLIELSVKDNGVGFDENFDLKQSDSLGLQLVKSLVNQLEGVLELKRNGGVEIAIRFQRPEFKKKKTFA